MRFDTAASKGANLNDILSVWQFNQLLHLKKTLPERKEDFDYSLWSSSLVPAVTKKLSQAHITFIGFPVRRKTPAPLLEETTTKGLELLVGNNFPHSLTTYTIVEQKPPIYICHAATASDHHYYCTTILHTSIHCYWVWLGRYGRTVMVEPEFGSSKVCWWRASPLQPNQALLADISTTAFQTCGNTIYTTDTFW